MEGLRSVGLTVPETIELLYELRQAGLDVPLDALSVERVRPSHCQGIEGTIRRDWKNPLEPIIETQKLTHIYSAGTPFEHKALDACGFLSPFPGSIVGIIGHTGSGKSTLIQHLNGLLKPTSGQVLLSGKGYLGGAQEDPADPLSGGAGVPVPGVSAL